MTKRKLLVTAVAKAFDNPRDTDIETSVQNCSPMDTTTKVLDKVEYGPIPSGSFLYGIKCKDGRYLKIVADNLLAAIHKLGVKLEDVKRGMSIKAGG